MFKTSSPSELDIDVLDAQCDSLIWETTKVFKAKWLLIDKEFTISSIK